MIAISKSGEIAKQLSGVKVCRTAAESRALANRKGPLLILAGSGMCMGGRILHHLVNHLSDPSTLILFVGYPSRGSVGRAIVDGAKAVRVMGRQIEIKAKVHTLGGLSGHAGQTDLLNWIGSLAPSKPRIFLTHGEDGARRELQKRIKKQFGLKSEIPDYGEKIVV